MTLATAALDPNAAVGVATITSGTIDTEFRDPPRQRVRALTMSVEVEPPPKHSRWRFFLFWCLVRMAAWVYPFRFEIYRTPTEIEKLEMGDWQ